MTRPPISPADAAVSTAPAHAVAATAIPEAVTAAAPSHASSAAADDTQPLLELFGSYPPGPQRIALDAILRAHEALTGERLVPATSSHAAAATAAFAAPPSLPAATAHAAALPAVTAGDDADGSVTSGERLSALRQLAESLSPKEAAFLQECLDSRPPTQGDGDGGDADLIADAIADAS